MVKTAWRSNYQTCVYASHLRPFSPFWLPHCDHLTFRLSAWPLEGRNRLLSNTLLSSVLFIPVSAYILQFCISHLTLFFLLNFRCSNFCPVGFFDAPILLYLTHLHLQPRVCPLPLLGDCRQLDLTTIKYLDDSPPFKLCGDRHTRTRPPLLCHLKSPPKVFQSTWMLIKYRGVIYSLPDAEGGHHYTHVLDRTCNYYLFYETFFDGLWAYCVFCSMLHRTGFVVYRYIWLDCITHNCIWAISWLHTQQFLQMNTWSYIPGNLCGPLQMFAGVVKVTFMVVPYDKEIAHILIHLYTWISKFTWNLWLYMVMYSDTFSMHFCWCPI